ncbi:MAG: SDR family NAD(P)-dependent oxidoreductase, partial [Actinobacteria bacterium]
MLRGNRLSVRKKPIGEQVIVVTGASSGVGRAIARAAGERGAKVVVGDLAGLEQNEELVRRSLERFGRIDTFVANAIVTVYAEVEQLGPDELRRVMDVNFFGVAYGYRAALPALKESRGTFLHVSSALAYRGIPLQAAYCSSKAAARAYLESARVELQKHGHDVAISLVLPGAI